MSPEELRRSLSGGRLPDIRDLRRQADVEADPEPIPGAVRMDPAKVGGISGDGSIIGPVGNRRAFSPLSIRARLSGVRPLPQPWPMRRMIFCRLTRSMPERRAASEMLPPVISRMRFT